MRVLFSVLLFLLYTSAHVFACSKGQKTTGSTYSPCQVCDLGSWCDGENQTACPENFSFSDRDTSTQIGAKSQYECYKKLNGETSNGHGAKCKDQSNSDIEYSDSDNTKKCRAYYRGEGQNPYVSCDGTTGTDSGTGEIEQSQNIDSAGYHMEGNQCYFNTRNCKLFTLSGNSCDTDNISGVLTWGQLNRTDLGWRHTAADNDVCLCKRNVESKKCYAQIFATITSRDTINETTISFNENTITTDPQSQTYSKCLGCLPGAWTGDADDWPYAGCYAVPAGYYSIGCGILSNGNTNRDCYDNQSPYRIPCYAGMTSAAGSDGPEDCHYTNDTQFCDAYGCVSMEQLLNATGTSQNDWTWYMQQ